VGAFEATGDGAASIAASRMRRLRLVRGARAPGDMVPGLNYADCWRIFFLLNESDKWTEGVVLNFSL
jgi:hypothetical protein